jgi:hypothetical protein
MLKHRVFCVIKGKVVLVRCWNLDSFNYYMQKSLSIYAVRLANICSYFSFRYNGSLLIIHMLF